MNTLIETLLKRIQQELVEVKKESVQKKLSNQADVIKLFTNKIPREIRNNFFNSTHVISNKYITLIYIDNVLYVKPHKINIGAMINVPEDDRIIKSLEMIFIASSPKQRFGEKQLKSDHAIKLVSDVITEYASSSIQKAEIFRII